MSETKKRYSYLKFSQKDLEDLGIANAEQPTECALPKQSSGKKPMSFIKLPEKWLQEEYRLHSASKARKRTLNMIESSSTNSKKTATVRKEFKNKRTTISRRSAIGKREVIKKSTIKNFLSSKVTEIGKLTKDSENTINYVKKPTSRKELFKVLPTASGFNTNTNFKLPVFNHLKNSNKIDQSPLIDIQQAEKILKTKSVIKQIQTTETIIHGANIISPSTSGTTEEREVSEFELNEKKCKQPMHNNKISVIREILKKEADEFKELTEKFEQFKYMRTTQMAAITELLNEIDPSSVSKLQLKASTPQQKPSVNTPKRSTNRAYNLRTNLLRQSLNANSQKSSKQKSAQTFYKDLQKNFSILETPQLNKKSPISGTKNLAKKLQEQCLMLVETPKHKDTEK